MSNLMLLNKYEIFQKYILKVKCCVINFFLIIQFFFISFLKNSAKIMKICFLKFV